MTTRGTGISYTHHHTHLLDPTNEYDLGWVSFFYHMATSCEEIGRKLKIINSGPVVGAWSIQHAWLREESHR